MLFDRWRLARDDLVTAVLAGKRRIVLAGPPGTGKTMLLHDVARLLRLAGWEASLFLQRSLFCPGRGAGPSDSPRRASLVDEGDQLHAGELAAVDAAGGAVLLAGLPSLVEHCPGWLIVRLERLTPPESEAYIRLWLGDAGLPSTLWQEDAAAAVAALGGGVPRLMANLLRGALWLAEIEGADRVTRLNVEEAAAQRDCWTERQEREPGAPGEKLSQPAPGVILAGPVPMGFASGRQAALRASGASLEVAAHLGRTEPERVAPMLIEASPLPSSRPTAPEAALPVQNRRISRATLVAASLFGVAGLVAGTALLEPFRLTAAISDSAASQEHEAGFDGLARRIRWVMASGLASAPSVTRSFLSLAAPSEKPTVLPPAPEDVSSEPQRPAPEQAVTAATADPAPVTATSVVEPTLVRAQLEAAPRVQDRPGRTILIPVPALDTNPVATTPAGGWSAPSGEAVPAALKPSLAAHASSLATDASAHATDMQDGTLGAAGRPATAPSEATELRVAGQAPPAAATPPDASSVDAAPSSAPADDLQALPAPNNASSPSADGPGQSVTAARPQIEASPSPPKTSFSSDANSAAWPEPKPALDTNPAVAPGASVAETNQPLAVAGSPEPTVSPTILQAAEPTQEPGLGPASAPGIASSPASPELPTLAPKEALPASPQVVHSTEPDAATMEAPLASTSADGPFTPAPDPSLPARSTALAVPPAAAAAGNPALSVAPPLPQATLALLLRRGDQLLAVGDLSGARLMFGRAAASGSAAAAIAMGKTYDPAFLNRIGAVIAPNPAAAAEWYRRGAALGGADAGAQPHRPDTSKAP